VVRVPQPPGRPSVVRRAAATAALTARAPVEARFPFRSPAKIDRAQRLRLRAVVRHAHEHVPYYRETFRRLGLTPGDITTAADLAQFPLLARDDLQRDPEYFVSDAQPLEAHVPLRTSGSTGEPIVFYRDRSSLFQRLLGFQRMEPVLVALTGKRWRRRHALIAPISSSTSDVNKATRQGVLPSVRTVHRSFDLFAPITELATAVATFEPDVVTGYGSAIEALFVELLRDDRPPHLPSVAVFAADGLAEPMRREITAAGVHVLSVYQAVETTTIGFECEAHAGHHLNVDVCPLRIVDDEGRDLPPETPGQVVVSNLVNRGTILLNYRLGDIAARLPGRCECGRSLPRLSGVEGRVNEWLRSADGAQIHPQVLRSILRKIPGLLRYQLVQEAPGVVRIVAVAEPSADPETLGARIEAETTDAAEALEVEVTLTDTLSRSAAGKVRGLQS
jgi:phenylacetate-CoA ligase